MTPNARLRLGNRTERDELLARLSEILTEEDRDDLRAALERRPVVPKGDAPARTPVRAFMVNRSLPSFDDGARMPPVRELVAPPPK